MVVASAAGQAMQQAGHVFEANVTNVPPTAAELETATADVTTNIARIAEELETALAVGPRWVDAGQVVPPQKERARSTLETASRYGTAIGLRSTTTDLITMVRTTENTVVSTMVASIGTTAGT